MLKVVSIVDKTDTAIDRLAQAMKPYMTNLDYSVLAVHPKRPDEAQLKAFEQEAYNADIIQFDYFRTALMLLEKYPWLSQKHKILTHYNPYSINESDWKQFDKVIACNKSIAKDLNVSCIPLATDPFFWEFNQDWVPTKRVIMVANRIEAKKGILEVAIACGDLGLTFVLVGAISDREYFYSILQTGNVEFHEQISDEALRDLYYGAAIHVCNSVDNFESGTMPILEAMQCGTPVLTRLVGHVPDLDNGENLQLLEGQPNDVAGITEALSDMLNDKKALEDQRQKAWNTAKNFNPDRRAYSYQRLYRSLFPGEPVSIVVPIYDKPEVIRGCLNAIANQTYQNIEIIVCDDSKAYHGGAAEGIPVDPSSLNLVDEFAKTVSFPVRYMNTNNYDDYGLARARNKGIIEATGDIIVFCDQRNIMEPDCVQKFVDNLVPKTWLYGDKGGHKETFVENLSCISRTDIVEAGMFNERCTQYGAMTQEIRSRTRQQGIHHVYIPEAKAVAGKSSNKNKKKMDIIASKNWLWKVGL